MLTSETIQAKLLVLALVRRFAPLANIAAPPMREYDTFSLQEEEEYFVNEEPVERRLARKLLEYTERRFRKIVRCPFCRTKVEIADVEECSGYVFYDALVWRCSYCGFWQAINDVRNVSESPASRLFAPAAAKP